MFVLRYRLYSNLVVVGFTSLLETFNTYLESYIISIAYIP